MEVTQYIDYLLTSELKALRIDFSNVLIEQFQVPGVVSHKKNNFAFLT